jgi:hypothetical protein
MDKRTSKFVPSRRNKPRISVETSTDVSKGKKLTPKVSSCTTYERRGATSYVLLAQGCETSAIFLEIRRGPPAIWTSVNPPTTPLSAASGLQHK